MRKSWRNTFIFLLWSEKNGKKFPFLLTHFLIFFSVHLLCVSTFFTTGSSRGVLRNFFLCLFDFPILSSYRAISRGNIYWNKFLFFLHFTFISFPYTNFFFVSLFFCYDFYFFFFRVITSSFFCATKSFLCKFSHEMIDSFDSTRDYE